MALTKTFQEQEENFLNVEPNEQEDTPIQDLLNEEYNVEPTRDIPVQGLSNEEYNDANKIKVTIADTKIPIVVLFGAPACGKTMLLIRLTRYLKENGYTVQPIRSFRPDEDSNYKKLCDDFDNLVMSEEAAKSTDLISFMLVKVLHHGRPICQILEAPGEYYYNPKNPRSDFPKYVNTICSSKNRKIWVLMTEPDWKNQSDRDGYVEKIRKLRNEMRPKDSTIILYNKIDKTPFIDNGRVNVAEARKDVQDMYPGIYKPFRENRPILQWFQEYRFDFIPFQSGYFNSTVDGHLSFTNGNDEYPRNLWKIINKRIFG